MLVELGGLNKDGRQEHLWFRLYLWEKGNTKNKKVGLNGRGRMKVMVKPRSKESRG